MALAGTRPEALLPTRAFARLGVDAPDVYANLRMKIKTDIRDLPVPGVFCSTDGYLQTFSAHVV